VHQLPKTLLVIRRFNASFWGEKNMDQPLRIALYGGTFDPVHLGHLHVAELAKNALELDEVRFLPCRISPHKSGRKPSSGEDRLTMLKLATTGLPWAVVDDFELERDGPSYSYETAEWMAARYPAARLFWIMGGDQWDALSNWKHPERLAACVEFAVLSRGETVLPRDGFRLHVVEGGHPASSTAIRQNISQGAVGHPWLAPAVAEWIEEKRLYFG
jgi:nicotinate-nucleotide adenylyltransferase